MMHVAIQNILIIFGMKLLKNLQMLTLTFLLWI